MNEDLRREIDAALERGRQVELVHYKMLEELPDTSAGIWKWQKSVYVWR